MLTLEQYRKVYVTKYPNTVPKKSNAAKIPFIFWPLLVALLAVNILSALHTGPIVARTVVVEPPNPFLTAFVSIIGVLGLEFVVFVTVFMNVANNKSRLLRGLVITLAVAVTVASNLFSTNEALTKGVIQRQEVLAPLTAIGFVLGVFPPLANIILAEITRYLYHEEIEKRRKAVEDYHNALIAYDEDVLNKYRKYLNKKGVTDIEQMIAGGEVTPSEPMKEPSLPKLSRKEQEILDLCLNGTVMDFSSTGLGAHLKNPNSRAKVRKHLAANGRI